MNRRLLSTTASVVALIAIMLSGFTLADSIHFGLAQSSTPVIGIINSDTTWTKANSPYSLTGPVAVSSGVTLTIESGTTVNLNSYYIQVNGTLTAKGKIDDKVQFNGGTIYVTAWSPGWNEQTQSGSIIENAVISTSIYGTSVKMDNDSITCWETFIEGSSVFSNNQVNGGVYLIGDPVVSDNIIDGGISVLSGSRSGDFPTIVNNTIGVGGIVCAEYAVIANNSISCGGGIRLFSSSVGIGGASGVSPLITNNLITNNSKGISFYVASGYGSGDLSACLISNNTISQNDIGIFLNESNYDSGPTLLYNNIQDNNFSIYLDTGTKNNVNATYNWWGTTDTVAINQSIHDFKNDFNLGNLTFVPFLTEPNPEAPTFTPTPTPPPTPNQSPSPSPSPFQNPTASPEQSNTQTAPQTELYEIVIATLILAIAAVLIAGVALIRLKKK